MYRYKQVVAVICSIAIIFILGGCMGASNGPVAAPDESSAPVVQESSATPVTPPEPVAVETEPTDEEINQQSEEWKRAVFEKVKELYDEVTDVPSNDRGHRGSDFGVGLCDLKDGSTVGVEIRTSGGNGKDGFGGTFYRFIDGSLDEITNGIGCSPYYNVNTGDIDIIHFQRWMHGGYCTFENGKWRERVVQGPHNSLFDDAGNETIIPLESDKEYDPELYKKFEAIIDNIEKNYKIYEYPEKDNFNVEFITESTGRYIPWEKIAPDLSDFLDGYDGINTDLAGKENLRSTDIEVAPPEWADTYAAVVKAWQESDESNSDSDKSISSFALMDVFSTGTPNLLVTYHELGTESNQQTFVFDIDLAERYSSGSDNLYDMYYSNGISSNISGDPLRYFKNDKTGEIIFSTYDPSFFNSIIYVKLENFETYKRITDVIIRANEDRDVEHSHILYEGNNTTIIEELEPTMEQGKCGIEYGLNAPDPTIIKLVNKALEDYTEITAPKKYTYKVYTYSFWEGDRKKDDVDRQSYSVNDVQDWIYKIAAEIG